MNTPSRRLRAFVTSAAISVALAATSLSAAASDDALDPGSDATQRVSAKLAERIDASVSTDVADELQLAAAQATGPAPSAVSQSGDARRAAARERSLASIEERADAHTRVYIAIRERANNGVLVQ